ncbi:MAG: hypothetical protein ACKVP2_05265 [Burkholderiales bacterium]
MTQPEEMQGRRMRPIRFAAIALIAAVMSNGAIGAEPAPQSPGVCERVKEFVQLAHDEFRAARVGPMKWSGESWWGQTSLSPGSDWACHVANPAQRRGALTCRLERDVAVEGPSQRKLGMVDSYIEQEFGVQLGNCLERKDLPSGTGGSRPAVQQWAARSLVDAHPVEVRFQVRRPLDVSRMPYRGRVKVEADLVVVSKKPRDEAFSESSLEWDCQALRSAIGDLSQDLASVVMNEESRSAGNRIWATHLWLGDMACNVEHGERAAHRSFVCRNRVRALENGKAGYKLLNDQARRAVSGIEQCLGRPARFDEDGTMLMRVAGDVNSNIFLVDTPGRQNEPQGRVQVMTMFDLGSAEPELAYHELSVTVTRPATAK